jgi:hypothetical protein
MNLLVRLHYLQTNLPWFYTEKMSKRHREEERHGIRIPGTILDELKAQTSEFFVRSLLWI